MISAFIFFAHLFFALYIFTKKWQEESVSVAFQNMALIGILFAVGWAITGMIAKLLMKPEGFGVQFDMDTFSLSLLAIGEFFFYKYYYKESNKPITTEDKDSDNK